MYQLIPLHSCDYLKKILIKINVATDKGNKKRAKMKYDSEQTMKLKHLKQNCAETPNRTDALIQVSKKVL